jgi:M-phase inducer phosphatase 2
MQRRQNIAPHAVNFDIKCGSPEKDGAMSEDISFYSSNNPASSPRPCPISPCSNEMSFLSPGASPSKFNIENNVQLPRSISHDSTSMDSGYCGLSNNKLGTSVSSTFKFIEPRRPSTSSSPSTLQKTPSKFALSSSMNSSGRSFRVLSTGSCDATEDDFMDLMDMESLDEESQMPSDLSSLICKDIKSTSKTPENKRLETSARKCLNMNGGGGVKNSLFNSPSTPKTSTLTSSLITTPERQCLMNLSGNITPLRSNTTGAFKRPELPVSSPIPSKRMRCENDPPKTETITQSLSQLPPKRPVYRKSMSMNDAEIKNVVSLSSSDPNLIGDFTRPHCLPLIEGKHNDLKSISADTMQRLLDGEFNERVSSYKIIDCRYPYEYQGGHIAGAVNLYTQEQILEELMKNPSENADGDKRDILVFHCEFSSKRGPNL